MKKYEIELDNDTAEFFEMIASIVECPIEELLSVALAKQAEIIAREIP